MRRNEQFAGRSQQWKCWFQISHGTMGCCNAQVLPSEIWFETFEVAVNANRIYIYFRARWSRNISRLCINRFLGFNALAWMCRGIIFVWNYILLFHGYFLTLHLDFNQISCRTQLATCLPEIASNWYNLIRASKYICTPSIGHKRERGEKAFRKILKRERERNSMLKRALYESIGLHSWMAWNITNARFPSYGRQFLYIYYNIRSTMEAVRSFHAH